MHLSWIGLLIKMLHPELHFLHSLDKYTLNVTHIQLSVCVCAYKCGGIGGHTFHGDGVVLMVCASLIHLTSACWVSYHVKDFSYSLTHCGCVFYVSVCLKFHIWL